MLKQFLIVILILSRSLVYADEQYLKFLQSLPVVENCKIINDVNPKMKAMWVEEMLKSIVQGRNPTYLDEFHCLAANKGKLALINLREKHLNLNGDLLKFNHYAWIIVSAFHTLIYQKVKEVAFAAIKQRFNDLVDLKKIEINTFNYLFVQNTIVRRIEESFTNRYPPFTLTLAKGRSLLVYVDQKILIDVIAESRNYFRHPKNKEVAARGIMRMSERIIFLNFMENINVIYQSLYENLENIENEHKIYLKTVNEQNEKTFFSDSFIQLIINRVNNSLGKFDINTKFFIRLTENFGDLKDGEILL